ncbi:MAG: hypothetical protein QM803_05565 [Rhodocyclaceae bacterium]
MQPENDVLQLHLSAEALMRKGSYAMANGLYWQAWESYTAQRRSAHAAGSVEAFDEANPPAAAFWLLISGANAQFLAGDAEACVDTLVTVFELFKDIGLVVGNPFFHLRLGQASLELEPSSITDNTSTATDNLARALICGGIEIFDGEDPKYFSQISKILRPPAGFESWEQAKGYGCSVDKLTGAPELLAELFASKYGNEIGAA